MKLPARLRPSLLFAAALIAALPAIGGEQAAGRVRVGPGIVTIAGTIRHLLVTGTGDGSTFDIFADGVSLFSQFIAQNDSVGFAFNETATIGVGSTVDFVLGPNSTDLDDQPALKATITPEPSTFTLAAFGLLGMGWRRRKRM